jgi:hypothetical protein
MLNSQKDRLLKIVTASGMDPTDFGVSEARDSNGLPVFKLRLAQDTRLFFSAVAHPTDYDQVRCIHSTFSPDFREMAFQPDGWIGIEQAYVLFETWLYQHVKRYLREITIPDPWRHLALRPEIGGITLATPYDTATFTSIEQAQIREALGRFRNLAVAEFKLTQDRICALDDRVGYLSDAVTRLNRFDWKNVALSSIVTISTALSLSTEQGRLLAQLFKQAFSVVSGLLQ